MPFEAFSRDLLEEVLRRHPVTAQGRQFIENALGSPSRNVQGTTRNLVGDIPCPKMGMNAQIESGNTEHPIIRSYVFDNDIVGYTTQTPTIELIYPGRNGRKVRTRYTGDCLRFSLTQGVVLEEFKPATDREQLEEKFPGKFQRLDCGTYTSDPICSVVNRWGITFAVRFSDEISSFSHRNRNYLFSYLYPNARRIYEPRLAEVMELFSDRSARHYSDMRESCADQDVLNWAIANGFLHIDFDSALISTQQSQVLVFRDFVTLQAWKSVIRPDGERISLPSASHRDDLKPGDVFVFDGRRLTVTLSGLTTIYAVDDQYKDVAINLDLLATACRNGKVILPNAGEASRSPSRFWSTSPKSLSRAIKKVTILETIDAGGILAREDQYSESTIRRWRKLVREGEAQGLSPVEALIEASDDKGFRGTHIDPNLDQLITKLIKNHLENNKNKSINVGYYDIEKLVRAAGYAMIAKSSFYERVNKCRSLKTISESQGHKAAYQLEPVYWMLDATTPVHCERVLELVHFDSTLLDIELRSSISGEILGRPWLSIAVCAFTRRVVGLYLSFRPPSYLSSMMLLADIVRRYGRIPDAIIHDWGSEFKAKDFKYALTALSIARFVRPKSAPRFGSILERIFGTVTRELIDNIAGNTKLRKDVRMLTPSSDPSTHSGLWLADLYRGLEEFFFDTYDHRKHPTTLRTPREAYDASLIANGQRLHRIRRYDDVLSILMPTAKGRPRTIDPSRGIYANYRYYGHPALADLALSGNTTQVKPIPFDPGSVLAFLKGNWVICKSALSEELQQAPEIVRRCLYEEWLVEQRLVVASDDKARIKLRELIEGLNQKALENREYWKDRKTHDILKLTEFSTQSADDRSTVALAKLNDMMRSAVAAAQQSRDIGVLAGELL